MVVNSEVQNGSCVTYSIFGDMFDFQVYFIWISKNYYQYWVLFTWTTAAARQKKQSMVMKTYKELLGTCIKSKKAYINTVCIKSASKDSLNCFAIFGSSACQGQHVFSMSFLTCTAPWSSHTNVQELI